MERLRLSSSALQGLIVSEQSGFFRVETQDEQSFVCTLRGRLKEEAQSADLAAIGDHLGGGGVGEFAQQRIAVLVGLAFVAQLRERGAEPGT